MIPCDYCGHPFDPLATRWLCPTCGQHNHCCEGEPLPPGKIPEISVAAQENAWPAG